MKIKKSLLSVCLSISLMFGCFVPSINVYASSGSVSTFVDRFTDKFYEIANKTTGIILSPIAGARDSFIEWLGNNKQNYGGSSGTTDDFINNNFSYDSSNYNIGQNLINSMRDFNQYYISNNSEIIYVYTFDIQNLESRIGTETYNLFIDLMEQYPTDLYTLSVSGSTVYINRWEGVTDLVYHSYSSTYNQYSAILYSNGSGYIPKVTTYHKDSNSNVLSSQVQTNFAPSYKAFGSYEDVELVGTMDNCAVSIGSTQYACYKTSSDLPSENTGIQDYYISDSYNTNHVDNSMVLSISEVDNSITYNDVITYIDNFSDTNNRVPTTNEIYIFINNYTGNGGDDPNPTPTPTPTPDPGGDDDDDDDNLSIWDLLKKVLDFLSHIIDLVADFLADLVDSLGDIVTSLITNIFDIVNTLKDSIPNVIGELLAYLMPFLPEELTTLLSAFIVFSIIFGIIKIIRG